MSKVDIWHTRIAAPLPAEALARLLACADAGTRARVQAYRRWQDAHATLIGRAMVVHALGLAAAAWPVLELTSLKRPFLPGCPDFNISHSDGIVAVAVARQGQVGIDVERVRAFALEDAREVFTDMEWREIDEAVDREKKFFEWWTRKEAVMKADGRGFHLSPTAIAVTGGEAQVEGKCWHVHGVDLGPEFQCHIATSHFVEKHDISSFFFDI